MRTQLSADVNSLRQYQSGTNEILNKLRVQMETKMSSMSTGGPLAGAANPLTS